MFVQLKYNRAHDDPNFVNTQTYLPPELQIAPPKKASTVGGGGVGSGLVKATGLKSYGVTAGRGRGRRGRPPKHEVSYLILFKLNLTLFIFFSFTAGVILLLNWEWIDKTIILNEFILFNEG